MDEYERWLRLEGRYVPETKALLERIGKWMLCSRTKAEELFLRLREPKAETFEAWLLFEMREGSAKARGAALNYAHPSEVPPDTPPPRKAAPGQPDAFLEAERQEALKRRQEEDAARDREAAREAVPPPPEFLEAMRRLGKEKRA